MLLFHVYYRWSLGWMHQSISRGAMEVLEAWDSMRRWYSRKRTFRQYCVLQPMLRLGTFIGDHFAMLKSPQNDVFEWRLLHCGVQARNTILKEVVRDGWGNMSCWWVYRVWQLLCKVAKMQEHVCIIARCTHCHNIWWCHYHNQVQVMTRTKHKRIQNCLNKVPQDVHQHILGAVSLFNA